MPELDSLANPMPYVHAETDSVWTFPSVEDAAPIWMNADTVQAGSITEVVAAPAVPEWTTGIEGTSRIVNVGDNSGVLAICAGVMLVMTLSFRHSRKLLGVLWQNLLGMRQRSNLFDERTNNETRAIGMMAVQLSVCLGLLLYSAIASGLLGSGAEIAVNAANAFSDAAKLIGLAAGYYVAQLCAYWLLGYTFADRDGRHMLVSGFTASQSLLGFVLLVPALASIFYPSAAVTMVYLGGIFYILARIIFIFKGFRIFYTKFGSLLYFILYLCSLEIIPLIFVYKIALFLVKSPMIAL